MTWASYKNNFTEEAREKKYDEETINKFLLYAKNLFSKNLPIVFNVEHLSLLVGYKTYYIMGAAHSQYKFYRSFYINKRNGKQRKISEPLPALKEIQKWILTEILSKGDVGKFAKGYVLNRSIKDNAKFHRNKKLLLNLDIKDFFPSIGFDKVYRIFRTFGYSWGVSTLFANLCCLDECLPQGAPTSPTISNLVMKEFDKRIGGFCLINKINYTRYADDLTFSGDFDPGMVIKFVKKMLLEYRFSLNENKIKTKKPHQSQRVTGVIVNKKIQAPLNTRKKLRQSMYYINKYGIASHMEKKGITQANYINHLFGIANFILFLNPLDKNAQSSISILRKIEEDNVK